MRKLLLSLVLVFPAAASTLSILPPSATLRGPEARHQFLAEATVGTHKEDWTKKAHWTSSNPAIATVDEEGVVTPIKDGDAIITAASGDGKATAQIHVKDVDAPFTWDFKNDVLPVMTKVGCNQGACHGALAGKNGFKLTLRGYDPDADYDTLTRQSLGRRVNLSEPSHSLILLKPTMAIAHGGGQRFKPDSLEYKVISQWIAQGAPRSPEN
ncbi:Ig-like domain-containing protein, partial [Nevskia soli]|uniref:Ig-like domain-containing protein n=1 Tax=Nevskia soli TaxID=418856 RepID=UPI0015D94AEE